MARKLGVGAASQQLDMFIFALEEAVGKGSTLVKQMDSKLLIYTVGGFILYKVFER